ncbi:MAG TPA: hypothetical protein VNO79_14935 [Actinomycetota bacterium]|nr:hypothetical protein [Actinomycetota bacterium]
MTRRILLEHEGRAALLGEAPAPEVELQEAVKRNPELLPIDDFGMARPLFVMDYGSDLWQISMADLEDAGRPVLPRARSARARRATVWLAFQAPATAEGRGEGPRLPALGLFLVLHAGHGVPRRMSAEPLGRW